ncbi:UDP-N-acetylglucosamine 2-epimerase [Acaricomes phytoseiuli]|uniref:UDP-N-acetylglucosamine 2-epimerase n=1 Tax=Acaricomes phytoseiuli TaxID=291968 RepID=UPI0014612FBB|nr:UDP-N-acetylglucosamine 2-epimerase [Acaricomes phytoseiuli]
MTTVMAYSGTRAEAARLMPVLAALRVSGLRTIHLHPAGNSTAASIGELFGIDDRRALDLKGSGHRRTAALRTVLAEYAPDAMLIHPATQDSRTTGRTAHQEGIPVVSIDSWPTAHKAGTADLYLESHELHRRHLIESGAPGSAVSTIGSTTTDCFLRGISQAQIDSDQRRARAVTPQLRQAFRSGRQLDFLVAQRFEGLRAKQLSRCLQEFTRAQEARTVVFSIDHPVLARRVRAGVEAPNLVVTGALDYQDYCRVLARSTAVTTDVPSIQRDALTLGKRITPILESPALLSLGNSRSRRRKQSQDIAEPQSGDGLAALRAASAINKFLGWKPAAQPHPVTALASQAAPVRELQQAAC